MTDLVNAIANGSLQYIQALIDAGADIHAKSTMGLTPLHTAASRGRIDVVQILVRAGADIDAQDCLGNTPLQRAILRNSPIVLGLLRLGSNVHLQDHCGLTHLGAACRAGLSDVAVSLLQRGANVDPKDRAGRTPLQDAVDSSDHGMCILLIAHGADTAFMPDREELRGLPMLHAAVRGGFKDRMMALLELGHDPREEHRGKTAFDEAMERQSSSDVLAVLQAWEARKAVDAVCASGPSSRPQSCVAHAP